jgi:sulfite exporter TauE/SafE
MLSSIHPLGERGRGNRWVITVIAFTGASTLTGALVGAAFGALGGLITIGPTTQLAVVAVVATAAGVLDWLGVKPLGPRRQVNENWIGSYRGWVYGAGFGAQLGFGVATYVVTWAVYAMFVAQMAMGKAWGGAVIGAVFGLGRSLAPLLAGWIDRPSRLTEFHRLMARLGPQVRRVAAIGTTALGTTGLIGVIR